VQQKTEEGICIKYIKWTSFDSSYPSYWCNTSASFALILYELYTLAKKCTKKYQNTNTPPIKPKIKSILYDLRITWSNWPFGLIYKT
jgi:hypothetical protein